VPGISRTSGETLRRVAEAGSLRSDVDPDDVTMMLLGVFLSTTAIDSPKEDRPAPRSAGRGSAPGPGPNGH
jgi:hypothetical protein